MRVLSQFIDHFLNLYRERFNRPNLEVSPQARELLQNYSWPGNVRELRNCLERAAALSQDEMIEPAQFPFLSARKDHQPDGTNQPLASANLMSMSLEDIEREHILRVLADRAGNRERTAAVLGISTRTLYRKLREYEAQDASIAMAKHE